MNLEILCNRIIPVIKEVGKYILDQQLDLSLLHIERKGTHDYVSEVDKNAEKQLVERLHEILPDAGFITEEKTIRQQSNNLVWIIDPLDGTTNYLHGLLLYSISVALQHDDETVLGVVYEIGHDEIFYSWKGGASYCNGKEIQVSKCELLENAIVVTGFPYSRDIKRIDKLTHTLSYFLHHAQDVHRHGSSAVDLSYVACSRIDAYYEGFLNIWDIAAGILIAKNAGARVTDFNGGSNFADGNVVASNKNIYTGVMKGVERLR